MIYLMTILKSFVRDEANRNGVNVSTVEAWVTAGRYGHLVFDRRNYHTYVSGTTLPMAHQKRSRGHAWSTVDWTLSNTEIGRRLGCHPSTVLAARRRLRISIPSPRALKREVHIFSIYYRVTASGRGVSPLLYRELRDAKTGNVLKKGRHHIATLKRFAERQGWRVVKPQ